MTARYAHLERSLGADLFAQVRSCKVLVVGSGGIGVEILKNLVMSGFGDIEIVDLDTIDVSNLNRQFLFRSKHVGMSKSEVAREVALQFNPDAKIVAHHGNVKEERFGVQFISKFDIVLNALDNVGARQHVNRLCLAAKKPLIDAGTQGYLGQTNIHVGRETACFDCEPKTENKRTFAICTIRSTPDKPVHCIVWAKELFKLMFGNAEESMLSGTEPDEDIADANKEESADPDANATNADAPSSAEIKEDQNKEKEIRSQIVEAVASRPSGDELDKDETVRAYARRVFDAVFDHEIRFKLQLRNGYKGANKRPTPLTFEEASSKADEDASGQQAGGLKDQRIMSLKECTDMFVDSVVTLLGPERRGSLGDMVFDKDDALTLRFVTAASNLRCHCFNIERKSLWDTKGIAGNIIHAIATTNAIVAGLQTLEAIKILAALKRVPVANATWRAPSASAEDTDAASPALTANSTAVWVAREPVGRGYLLQATGLPPPNPKCFSCGNALVTLSVDTSKFTFGDLIDRVLKGRLGVNLPSIMLDASELYAEGDGLDEDEVEFFEANKPKALADCPAGGIKEGTIVDVEDFSQDMKFKVLVHQKVYDAEENPDLFEVGGEEPVAKPDAKEDSEEKASADKAESSSDAPVRTQEVEAIMSTGKDGEELVAVASTVVSSSKRPREDGEKDHESEGSKRSKTDDEGAAAVVVSEIDLAGGAKASGDDDGDDDDVICID
ncbi:Ubiquitin-activating enzyme, putative [Hondaea fermentalgiana]|uniref:Ubiquitin-activating enzyme, putative n=1 Tax=Hondaea fermentalgiana TaxID=2315210 RepID=A0A2R5GIE1_9STRA|nr:Ubiquitin-activating enzyme, putative [Hondaea fermentalgiana]|eukprot:GBG29498.1 Ubiquitin-activating enzyme, putative [Hondaea fermentalgiana]